MGLSGKILGNKKFLTSGDVINLSGTWIVEFDANGGLFVDPVLGTGLYKWVPVPRYPLQGVAAPTILPIKEGYTLSHWSTTTSGDAYEFNTTLVTGHLTLYAIWSENSCSGTEIGNYTVPALGHGGSGNVIRT